MLLWLASALAVAAETWTVGVVPQFEPMRLAGIWQPILAELEARTGERFVMEGNSDIPAFERGVAAGQYDFAYMNPWHAVQAMAGQGYVPMVRDGGRQLFGVLVVARDGPYKEVADLAGQTIDFPAPNALGASLMMRAELTQDFGLDFTPAYVATHSSSFLNVALGRAAAAGGVMATLRSQPTAVQEALRVIHTTRKVAPHPLMAHPRVPDTVRDRVTEALLAMAATDEGRALLAEVPFTNLIPATAEDYAPVAAMNLEAFAE